MEEPKKITELEYSISDVQEYLKYLKSELTKMLETEKDEKLIDIHIQKIHDWKWVKVCERI